MPPRYLHRELEETVRRAARQFPVVLVTGPRQTGKSTLLLHLFPKYRYITLDDPVQRLAARRDPGLFIENLGDRAIVDEIQYAPNLLSYFKMAVDRQRNKKGRYLLTGSQIFPVMAGLSETLAGRIAVFELLGFSWKELGIQTKDQTAAGCFRRIHRGFYPDPAVQRVNPSLFYSSYMATYLERDIRQIRAVHDLTLFQSFLELLAARAGSLLELTNVARDCGISHTVARQWLSLLEATRLVYLLRPYYRNISKRVVKTPKLYFTDSGLLAYLLKYPDGETLRAGPMAGAFFESMMVIEQLKRLFAQARPWQLYFYRDSNDNEIDLLIDHGRSLTAVEIKMSGSVSPEHAKALTRLPSNLPVAQRYLLSMTPTEFEIVRGVQALPWWKMASLQNKKS